MIGCSTHDTRCNRESNKRWIVKFFSAVYTEFSTFSTLASSDTHKICVILGFFSALSFLTAWHIYTVSKQDTHGTIYVLQFHLIRLVVWRIKQALEFFYYQTPSSDTVNVICLTPKIKVCKSVLQNWLFFYVNLCCTPHTITLIILRKLRWE